MNHMEVENAGHQINMQPSITSLARRGVCRQQIILFSPYQTDFRSSYYKYHCFEVVLNGELP